MIPTLTILICHLALTGEEASPSKLQHDTYSGYFVSNKFEPKAKQSFVVIKDEEQFYKVFGNGFVMHDKSHPLPKDAFKSNQVLAVIKRGNAFWEYKVDKVTVERGVVQFRYAATSQVALDTTFASPLIVSVPQGQRADSG